MRFFSPKVQLFLFSLFFWSISFSQNQWTAINDSTSTLDLSAFSEKVMAKEKVYLPLPDGGFVPFEFKPASILPETLGDKFSIHCFSGTCTLDKNTTATLTLYQGKIYGSIKFTDKQVNIKPADDSITYISQWINKPINDDHLCEMEESLIPIENTRALRTSAIQAVERMKNYTIAISSTGEYTAFHGGTKGQALAAIATTLNRVNSIYNADLGINLILHPNTDQLIFTSSTTDPYNNSSADAILNVAQDVFDDALGNNTYDLGHIFSTGAGGLADLNSVCTSVQASGVTGTTSPIGDFYDVDFVSHEIGHQFGADHTFNGIKSNCAGNVGDSRFEIGSGSTIMAYAGICGSDNLQSHSDPYFHIQSIKEIKSFINTGSGSTCGFYSSETNTIPEIISQTPNSYTIPVSTPFVLDGSAADADGDDLFYNWEQMDLGSSVALNSPIGSSPIFRSFSASSETKRFLPRLPYVLANSSSKGEILPTYDRELNFSFNVRDQKGGVTYGLTRLSVSTQSGPFTVSTPGLGDNYQYGQTVEFTWDVANTNLAPVNCQEVMIILSYDNGLSFSDTLVKRTANDGQAFVKIPNTASTNCRIMVKAYDNVFFAVNSGRFSITEPQTDDFNPLVTLDKNSLCSSNDQIKVKIKAEGYKNFSDSIRYTISSSSAFLNLQNTSGIFFYQDSVEFVLSANPNLTINQEVTLDLEFTSGSLSHNSSAAITLFQNETPSAAELLSPANNSVEVSLQPFFEWAGEDFSRFQVFLFKEGITVDSSLILNLKHFTSDLLAKNSNYQWQVKTYNTCGNAVSETFNFSTTGDTCVSYFSDTLPMPLPDGTVDFYNKLFISTKGVVNDISIVNLNGSHEWTSDLKLFLISPSGRSYSLFSDVCEGFSGSNFNLNLLNDSNLPYAPCPPTGGGNYQPLESFQSILGTSSQGLWTLHIKDVYPEVDEGTLKNWGIRFCIDKATYSGAPFLIQNTPSSISIGSVEELQSSNLLAWDDVSKTSNISFQLVDQTPNLVLVQNNTQINTGESFTQEDLIAGAIGVQMNDSLEVSYLAFTLKNSANEVSDTLYHFFNFNGVITSLEKTKAQELFQVSPNPVSQTLTIENYSNKEVRVINLLGQLLLETTIAETLDVSSLQQGVYLLQLENGQVIRFEKN